MLDNTCRLRKHIFLFELLYAHLHYDYYNNYYSNYYNHLHNYHSFINIHNMKKILFFGLVFTSSVFCSTVALHAQDDVDALRYTQIQTGGGTARAQALGGTLGALGADFSSASGNPAGLAQFRQGEFSLSPGLFLPQTNSTVVGDSKLNRDSKVNFNIGHLGLVEIGRASCRERV